MSDERLPEGFSFEDFLGALDAIDAPADDDLPTDDDGCVELVTTPVAEVAATIARLRDASILPHLELPDEREAAEPGATSSVFVPRGDLARARRVLGLAT
ncbi:MAG: hypothetical protein ACXVQU_13270 [Actinomycetota bacterium]